MVLTSDMKIIQKIILHWMYLRVLKILSGATLLVYKEILYDYVYLTCCCVFCVALSQNVKDSLMLFHASPKYDIRIGESKREILQ